MHELENPVEVEVLGGVLGHAAASANLLFAIHTLRLGLAHRADLNEELNRAGHLPGKMRRTVTVPLDIAHQFVGIALTPNVLDEGKYSDFKKGRWGEDAGKMIDWIRLELFPHHISSNLDRWGVESRSLLVVRQGEGFTVEPHREMQGPLFK
ncbi:MAG: hypothetical protein KIS61_30100 [Candidatus Eremiobacteraeota bacterium]|nr:hypothetical protein [Candidatus Eremiobacteraeota bacterium]